MTDNLEGLEQHVEMCKRRYLFALTLAQEQSIKFHVAALAEPLRQSQRVEGDLSYAEQADYWHRQVVGAEKRIEELEAALREVYEATWTTPGTNRPMRITQIINQVLDTEAKP